MRRLTTILLAAAAIFLLTSADKNKKGTTQGIGYPISPVQFTSVKVSEGFWGQRLKASREVTIPLAFSKCEETGRYENFIKAANPPQSICCVLFPFYD